MKNKGFVYLSGDETSVMLKALREEQEAMVAEGVRRIIDARIS